MKAPTTNTGGHTYGATKGRCPRLKPKGGFKPKWWLKTKGARGKPGTHIYLGAEGGEPLPKKESAGAIFFPPG